MHKRRQIAKHSPQPISDYGISMPSSSINTSKPLKRQMSSRGLLFSQKGQENTQRKQVIARTRQNIEPNIQRRTQKKFVRSNSDGKLPRVTSAHLLSHRGEIFGEKKRNPESILQEKCLSEYKGLQEKGISTQMRVQMKQLGKIQQLKFSNQKLSRQIAILNHELFIKNTQINDLKKNIQNLQKNLKTAQSSIHTKNKENLELRSVLQQNNIKIAQYKQKIKDTQSSTKYSISTKQDLERCLDFPQTHSKPIIEIDTEIIISNLQKTIQYQEIEIGMLKKNRYEMDEMKIECLLWKKENKSLKNEIRRLKDNNSVLGRKPKNRYLLDESITLQISKEEESQTATRK